MKPCSKTCRRRPHQHRLPRLEWLEHHSDGGWSRQRQVTRAHPSKTFAITSEVTFTPTSLIVSPAFRVASYERDPARWPPPRRSLRGDSPPARPARPRATRQAQREQKKPCLQAFFLMERTGIEPV